MFVAAGSFVDVWEEKEGWRCVCVEKLEKGDLVRTLDGVSPVQRTVVHPSKYGVAPLCTLGGLRALDRQFVRRQGCWFLIGDLVRGGVTQSCRGVVGVVLPEPSSVIVDGVPCLSLHEEREEEKEEATFLRSVSVRLGGSRFLKIA